VDAEGVAAKVREGFTVAPVEVERGVGAVYTLAAEVGAVVILALEPAAGGRLDLRRVVGEGVNGRRPRESGLGQGRGRVGIGLAGWVNTRRPA
jgi:hypothetical protein